MTKRQKIATSFVSALSAITIAGGYRTNFPTVKHWSNDIEPKENETVVVVKDRTINSTEDSVSEKEVLIIDIHMACCIANTNYATICNMIDDVKKWYGANRKTLEVSMNVVEIKYMSDEVAVDRFEKEVGAGRVTFAVTTGQNSNWQYDDTEY